MINYLKNFWNGLCLRQKIIITIYFIIGLPVMPIVIPMWWFAKWVNEAKNVNDLDPIEYIGVSGSISIMTIIIFALIHWLA